MNNAISLKDALQIIEAKDQDGFAIPFDISFRTLNRNSKTGGALRSYNSVTILTSKSKQAESKALDISINGKTIVKNLQLANKPRKAPNHFENRTRNLQKQNGEIFKVNIRLITSINNQKVVY
jgi:flagellar capping protein FliD